MNIRRESEHPAEISVEHKPGYTIKILQEFKQRFFDRENIRAEVKLHLETKAEVSEKPVEREKTKSNKKEIAYLGAFFIEEIWAIAERYMMNKPGQILQLEAAGLGKDGKRLYKVVDKDFEDIKAKFESFEDWNQALNLLEKIFLDFMHICCLDEQNIRLAIENGTSVTGKGQDIDNKESLYFKRMKDLILNAQHGIIDSQGNQVADFAGFFYGGFNSAVKRILKIGKILPKVYFKQFQRKVGQKEYFQIMKSSKPFILFLANMHDSDFFALLRNISEGRDQVDGEFISEAFEFLSDEKGLLYLEIKPDTLTKIINEWEVVHSNYMDPEASIETACPALSTPGQHGKNVISELYDRLIDLKKQLLQSKMQKYGIIN